MSGTELTTGRNRRVATFSPSALEQSRDHLLQGLLEQDRVFLEACAQTGTDPRASVRVAVGGPGLVAVSIKPECVANLLRFVRSAPRRLELDFTEAPVFDDEPTPSLPPPSLSKPTDKNRS